MDIRPNIDDILSGFDPVRSVGQGGMASIYLYENRLTGEQLAVKTLHSHIAGDPGAVERFYHEVQANLRLDHRNIVHVLGYGDWQEKPAIVMEYVDGGDLKTLMTQVSRLPVAVALYIAENIFRGLDYSHRLGIIHRDVKPSNILINASGHVKITDFGISQVSDLTRLTVSGDVLGTPAYMSPEQASGKKLDERSDVFSAGVLLYEMLVNSNPFLAENASVTLLNIIRCNPPPVFEMNPTVPYKLEVLLDRLLTRSPEERIQSAAETADHLRQISQEISSGEFTEHGFVEFLRNPVEFVHTINMEDSFKYLEKGKNLLNQEKKQPERAAVEFYRSLFVYPGNVEAQQYLTSITRKLTGGVQKPSAKLLELETLALSDPNNVAILMQIIKRARAEGDFIKAISFSKRLARLRPTDVYILGQIETLLPDDHHTSIVSTAARPFAGAHDTRTGSNITRSVTAEMSREEFPAVHGERRPVRPVPVRYAVQAPSAQPILKRTSVRILLMLGCAIGVGLFAGHQFRKASDQVEKEIPLIVDKLLKEPAENSGSQGTDKQHVTGRARELLLKAQNAFSDGDRPGAVRHYQEFLGEFPDHKESEGVRIQLSRLLVTVGDIDAALRILDDQIRLGSRTAIAYARLEKIRLFINQGRPEDARWECIYLEPDYTRLASPQLQMEFLFMFAGICRDTGAFTDAIRMYDRIITGCTDTDKVLEARMMRADVLTDQGDLLEAQRELWLVRDKSRPGTLIHKTAIEKLGSLGLGDSSGWTE